MKRLLVVIALVLVATACGKEGDTNVYSGEPTPTPDGSPTPTPTPSSGNPYFGAWNHFEMKNVGNGSFTDLGTVEVDDAGDFGIGLIGGTDDTVAGNVTVAGVVTGTFYFEGGTCVLSGTCESASYCWGTIAPACSGAQWDMFALDRNQ